MAGIGINLTSDALVGLGRALKSRLMPEQQVLLERTVAAAVEEAARLAGDPAAAMLELVTREESLAALAALALAAPADRPIFKELGTLLGAVDWSTSGVDQQDFFGALVPAVREAVIAVGRSGGPLAALTLNLRLDELQRQHGGPPQEVIVGMRDLPPLPPPVPELLDELFSLGASEARPVRDWLTRFNPSARSRPLLSLVKDPPAWLNSASGRGWLLIGELSAAYDDTEAATIAYLAAADRGLRSEWRLRAKAAYLMFADGRHNSQLLRTLEPAAESDEFVAVVAAAARGDWQRVLSGWEIPPEDTEALRFIPVLRVVALVHQGDWRAARTAAMSLQQASPDAPGPALLAAKTLLGETEAQRGEQQRREAATTALQLALRARDMRRTWRGPSGQAVEVAAQAAVLLHDVRLALRLCLPKPDGDALADEAAHEEVRATAATLAAVTGHVALAKDLASTMIGADRELVLAAVAEAEQRRADAAAHARKALETSTNVVKRQQAALLLAGVGALQDADVADFDEGDAVLLTAVNLAESDRLDDAYVLLRRHGDADTARFAQLSALILAQTGQFDLAAGRLEDAAARFGDPGFRVSAARYWAQAGDWEAAAVLALEATAELDRTSPEWIEGQALLVECYARRGDWPAVERAGRAVLHVDPAQRGVRWALTLALYNRRRREEAWRVLQDDGDARRPAAAWQARLLIELATEFDPTAATARLLLSLADAFSEDEQLRAQVIMTLVRLPNAAFESDAGLLGRAQQHAANFLERFPTSAYLTSIPTTDEDELVSRLGAMLRPAAERWQRAKRAVDAGGPTGLLAAAASRPYAAVWPHRAAGHLPMTAPDVTGSDRADLLAMSASVAVDASVMHTLALLPELWPHVRAMTKELLTTSDAAEDILLARDSFIAGAAGSLSWDLISDRPTLLDADPTVEALLAERAGEMARGLRWLRAKPWPDLKVFPELDESAFRPWIGVVDYSITSGTTLYCDDVGLRRLARSHGARTFDTTSVIDWLHADGRLSAVEADAMYTRLASEFAVDLPDAARHFQRLLDRDGFESLPASYMLSRPAYWAPDVAATLEVARTLLSRITDEHSGLLARWTGMSALGLIRATGGLRAGVALVVEQILRPWPAEVRAALYYQLRGVAAELGTIDPLPMLVEILRDVLAVAVPAGHQARLILGLFEGLPEAERQAVVAALLRPDRETDRSRAAGPRVTESVSGVSAQAADSRRRLARELFGHRTEKDD